MIEIENLTHRYGTRRGIERVSLKVPEGALFGFLGPNGAGKTTTIRVLLGFLRPTSGVAIIFGRDCWHETKTIKQNVGYLPGDLRLPLWMDGTTALQIFGDVRGRDLTNSGKELAARFDLDLNVKVREMSRGMRQKLGIILALAPAPKLLVLDEPTNSLDPLMQNLLREQLREGARKGQTIFFSSHSLPEVEALCDHVAIVRDGKVVADESLVKLRDRAGHDVMIRWRDGASSGSLEPPRFLTLVRRESHLWEGRLEGPVQQLVDFLAGKPIVDLNISRPDLESLFRQFYEAGEEKTK